MMKTRAVSSGNHGTLMRKLCVFLALLTIASEALAVSSETVLYGLGYGYFVESPRARFGMGRLEDIRTTQVRGAVECFERPAAEALIQYVEGLPGDVLSKQSRSIPARWLRLPCSLSPGYSDGSSPVEIPALEF